MRIYIVIGIISCSIDRRLANWCGTVKVQLEDFHDFLNHG